MQQPPPVTTAPPLWTRWIAGGCVVLAAVAFACLEPGPFTVVAAGAVVPGWALSAALLALGGTSEGLGRTVRRSRRARPPTTWITRPAAGWSLMSVGFLTGLAVVLAVGYDTVFSVRHHVLEPAAPGGCRLVVAESSFTFAAGATTVRRAGAASP